MKKISKLSSEKYYVVITTNPLNHEGGVVAFYNLFLRYFSDREIGLLQHTLGSRMEYFYSPIRRLIYYPFYYVYDLISLLFLLIGNRQVRIVQVNPSLILVPLIRDGIVLLISRFLRRRVVVFFHGWKIDTLEYIKKHKWAHYLFSLVYKHASVFVVLSSRFRDDLISLGFPPGKIQISTTMYDANEIVPFSNRVNETTRFLFLGRLSQLKGVSEIIEAARVLSDRNYDCEFVMVGHGDRKVAVEDYMARVKEYGLESRFRFTGHLSGKEKYQVYADCDVYVLPSWTEGCPTSVLEALGSGLFVISTDVGALRDIIVNDENGRIVQCRDSEHLAENLAWTCENIGHIRRRRDAIMGNAASLYEVNVVSNQFRKLYKGLIDG